MDSKSNEYYDSKYEKIGQGSFASVYKCLDETRIVALKVSKNHSQMKQEYKIYKYLQGDVNWHKCYNLKKDKFDNYVLKLEYLGNKSLDYYIKNNEIDNRIFCTLATNMLKLVQTFHSIGYTHCDLKLQNFLIKPNTLDLYLIDYGLSREYKKDKNNHIDFQQGLSLRGNARYASVNTHLGVIQSRRDDLISLGYIMIYILNKKLPWQNMIDNDQTKKKKYDKIMLSKMSLSIVKLTSDIKSIKLKTSIMEYLYYVISLSFVETPDYNYLINLF